MQSLRGLTALVIAVVAAGSVACAENPEESASRQGPSIPPCQGSWSLEVDSFGDGAKPTREDAVAKILEYRFKVQVDSVVLRPVPDDRGFTVTHVNGSKLEAPPTVLIDDIDGRYIASTLIC